ncbi:metallopeptidase family protein [Nocardiopsis sp. RV163]|uniref:metallopeptidase family protein n=1 Tax=Nocardiopsis sp. RV163 TaxID=1661388 RepID=UPI00069FF4B4|nr:metallopeptidase family protein [Nocardiopsis sp. RV163]
MNANAMDLDAFEQLVSRSFAVLPEWVQRSMSDVALLVDDLPPSHEPGHVLLGRFVGVPRTRRGRRVPGSLPDRIELYRVPILGVCRSSGEVEEKVTMVLRHEIGHALGIGEERLRELGY